ncbi:hypothetical protein [Streptomyces sp. 7-21]|uniref:hypothetical protein n=1 Tax=Streptomyces sp. 7-21 TaxID=2802283 RepID=UPI00191E5E42|nr:hypothetical protein [Streptomyces sp. 7-21]MBL1067128.1 hypothetical protein [Streptomyces sp. 7-21]
MGVFAWLRRRGSRGNDGGGKPGAGGAPAGEEKAAAGAGAEDSGADAVGIPKQTAAAQAPDSEETGEGARS